MEDICCKIEGDIAQKDLETATAHTGKDLLRMQMHKAHNIQETISFTNSDMHCNVDEEDDAFKKPQVQGQ